MMKGSFGTMLVAVVLLGAMCSQVASGFKCEGYLCDKTLDSMVITMTHNALATPFLVFSPNQNYDLVKQFNDGMRGFELDIQTNGDSLWTSNGGDGWGYDPSDIIRNLVASASVASEFIVVQVQDEMDESSVDKFLALFGNKIIKNFDAFRPLGSYIGLGTPILVLSNKNVNPAKGLHDTTKFIVENDYGWTSCYFESPPFDERYPTSKHDRKAATLMNNFCSASNTGDMVASDAVNRKSRILTNYRAMVEQSYTGGHVNIIAIDYYELGDALGAQQSLRDGDPNGDCWSDGTLCGISTTCWNCCNRESYWWGKVMTACGQEPCWNNVRCLAGTSCNACCNGYTWDWAQVGDFCN